jgi:hypothetical protein
MGWVIKAVLGESLQTAWDEIERIETATRAKGMQVERLTPTTLEVERGSRKATEEVIDSPMNREHGSVYMEADTPAHGHFPA